MEGYEDVYHITARHRANAAAAYQVRKTGMCDAGEPRAQRSMQANAAQAARRRRKVAAQYLIINISKHEIPKICPSRSVS